MTDAAICAFPLVCFAVRAPRASPQLESARRLQRHQFGASQSDRPAIGSRGVLFATRCPAHEPLRPWLIVPAAAFAHSPGPRRHAGTRYGTADSDALRVGRGQTAPAGRLSRSGSRNPDPHGDAQGAPVFSTPTRSASRRWSETFPPQRFRRIESGFTLVAADAPLVLECVELGGRRCIVTCWVTDHRHVPDDHEALRRGRDDAACPAARPGSGRTSSSRNRTTSALAASSPAWRDEFGPRPGESTKTNGFTVATGSDRPTTESPTTIICLTHGSAESRSIVRRQNVEPRASRRYHHRHRGNGVRPGCHRGLSRRLC